MALVRTPHQFEPLPPGRPHWPDASRPGQGTGAACLSAFPLDDEATKGARPSAISRRSPGEATPRHRDMAAAGLGDRPLPPRQNPCLPHLYPAPPRCGMSIWIWILGPWLPEGVSRGVVVDPSAGLADQSRRMPFEVWISGGFPRIPRAEFPIGFALHIDADISSCTESLLLSAFTAQHLIAFHFMVSLTSAPHHPQHCSFFHDPHSTVPH